MRQKLEQARVVVIALVRAVYHSLQPFLPYCNTVLSKGLRRSNLAFEELYLMCLVSQAKEALQIIKTNCPNLTQLVNNYLNKALLIL